MNAASGDAKPLNQISGEIIMTTPQYNFTVNLDDLAFILKQIKIAEASTNPVTGAIENLPALVGSALLPYGLRTVDGTWNNLLPGQERFGAADNVMPRLVAGNFQAAEGRPVGFFFPGDPGTASSSYAQTDPGNIVYDTQPRIISNLIVDQTATNPAAVIAAMSRAAESTFPGMDVVHTTVNGTQFIPNQSPDIGLSAPFNGVMTFFGQFFDHGLDLITKGGGTVFVPLMPDDPLYVAGSPTNFMVLSRAVNTTGPGPDGVLGTADDDPNGHTNTTTPFVDQNQTYTSHPSHQVFLREYVMVDGKPLATGRLLTGAHGEGNWGEVKAQASHLLGVHLTDTDVFNGPLLATDRYGEFLRGAHGFVQIVTATGLVEGDPTANGGLGVDLPANTVRTDHQFLIDIAHGAIPTPGLVADSDTTLGGLPNPAFDPTQPITTANPLLLAQPAGTYDDEMLDRHFATGDGRGNENIGLTTMHSIFHSEHNRLVADYKQTILASGDLALLNDWLLVDVAAMPTAPAAVDALVWDGERLFQAGRFVTEMQYQHLVFEEFARAVQPQVDPFVFTNSPDINPAIVEEFANVVYRFGHSMLTETVARLDPNLVPDDIGLIQAFLNPPEFDKGGVNEATAIGGIIRGMSRQVGNEIDEFITEALRNNLVGLPLDLAVLNMARARETGAPTFNEARAEFFAATNDNALTPYTSWADFAPHLKNPASIINFIAAYGLHDSIASETTLAGKRAAATLMVMGDMDLNGNGTIDPNEHAPADRVDFLTGHGAWNAANSGLNKVDFWIGGLAEAKLEFGGMLGPTFNYVFETQLEKLQNGDRMYYLSRTQGLNLLNELEPNLFSALVMRNSNLGDPGTTTHLPGHLFRTPSYILEMNQDNQRTGIVGPDGHTLNGDPTRDDPFLNAINPLVIRVAPGADVNGDGFADGGVLNYAYDGGDHVVIGGTQGNDTLMGGRGMDTIWGDAGNDRIDGGDEEDEVHGGDGDDIITDHGTVAGGADFLRGDEGNDVISNGTGNDVVFGGGGSDFVIVGPDFTEVFAGRGDDFVLGGQGPDNLMGNEGDDWIEGGGGFDTLSGENSQLFFNSTIIGNDVLDGQGNDTDYDGESGDDIMVQGPGIQRSNGMFGFDWGIHKGDPVAANSDLGIPLFTVQTLFTLRDRFDGVEGLSGWKFDDILTGASLLKGGAAGFGNGPGNAGDVSDLKSQNVSLINGFAELLGLTPAQVAAMPFNTSIIDITQGAEVIIGGHGSDTIRGNLGNDYLDGDAWLNVRISIRANKDGTGPEIRTVDSMNEIKAEMLAGTINPGQLKIVREIIIDPADSARDTAVYSDNLANYDITLNADGTRTVNHARGTATDGIDTIRNFEQLRFADQLLLLDRLPTGAPSISDATPTEGHPLTASPGTIVDLDGTTTSTFSYQWQQSSGLSFVDIAGATAATFTPAQAQVGFQLRVLATFTDDVGFVETVASAPTGGVGDLIIGNGFANTLNGTAFDDDLQGRAGNDILNGAAGNDLLAGEQGNDLLNGGTGSDTMVGGTGNDTYVVDSTGDVVTELAGEGTDTVQTTLASYSLGADVENLSFTGAGNFTGTGNALNNSISGGAGNDILVGGAGDDTLNGLAGADSMTGGAGADIYVVDNAGDVVTELAGEGTDMVRTANATYTLGLNVENLQYTGLSNFTGNGNSTSNTIWGGAGNDNISTGASVDWLVGGGGNDLMNGGSGNDFFVFAAGFGHDIIQDFDANPLGGQDKLNVSALGITAVTFASSVNITDIGADTLVQIGANSITLLGIDDATTVSMTDFVLAP
jgi:Ca2+-binding RTX toxin-like protein